MVKSDKMGFERAAEQEQVRLGELLWDLHAAAMKIVEFTNGRDFNDFAATELLQQIVASMLGIITGALRQMQNQFPDEFAKISNANRLLDTASRAAPLATEELWHIVEELIPELVAEARILLEDWHQA